MIVQLFYLVVSHISFKVLPSIYQYIYSRCRSHQVWMNLRKKYVLISGATGKVGRGLARKFAERGMGVILVGKDEGKLVELQMQINKIAECHVYVVSHGRSNLSFVDNYDIGVLVNCAGCSNEQPSYFVEQPIEETMSISLVGTLLLTKRVVANMMENRYGYVLNIGSLMCEAPTPLYATFGTSKCALRSLSDSLYYELETYNINVEYINAGYVAPGTSGCEGASLFVPNTNRFAESVLDMFGSGRMSVPYLPHFIQYLILLCIPSPILSRLILYRNQQTMARMKEGESSTELKTK